MPFEQDHGFGTVTTGFRIGGSGGQGGMAYSTDVVRLPEESLAQLHGLDLWVVDCLRFEPHPTHAHFDQVLEWVSVLKPKRTVLTHLNHTIDYEVLRRRCPPGMEPGYDGLVVEVGGNSR
jgi:phosphoribosyl 1,2-cyclic phosphate phosphodiesterase